MGNRIKELMTMMEIWSTLKSVVDERLSVVSDGTFLSDKLFDTGDNGSYKTICEEIHIKATKAMADKGINESEIRQCDCAMMAVISINGERVSLFENSILEILGVVATTYGHSEDDVKKFTKEELKVEVEWM